MRELHGPVLGLVLAVALLSGRATAQATCTIIISGDERPCDETDPGVAAEVEAPESLAPLLHDRSSRPNILPYFGRGFASPEEVVRAVGRMSVAVEACPEPDYFYNVETRIVRASLARVPEDLEHRPELIDALLREAAHSAYEACPVPYVDISDVPKGDYHYDLRTVSLHGPDGALLLSARLGTSPDHLFDRHGDQALRSSRAGYVWSRYVNGFEQRRQAAAASAAQAARRAEFARRAEEQRLRSEAAAASFWWWVRALVGGAIALWLFLKREAIARWYYLNFDPHPATSLVQHAIAGSGPLDGRALAEALAHAPADNPVLQRVRMSQAENLYRSLRAESIRRQEEVERRARAGALAAYERAAYESVKEAVALAALALERAKNAQRAAEALRRI